MLGKAGVHRRDPSSDKLQVDQDGTSAYAVFSSVWQTRFSIKTWDGREGREGKVKNGRMWREEGRSRRRRWRAGVGGREGRK